MSNSAIATPTKSARPPHPLKVLFCITSMPVGGAETLLVNLIRRLDRNYFHPELCCLKELGPLGEVLADEIPTYSHLIGPKKYDVRVLFRLKSLMKSRKIDAVITVGAGDKMFWGRLAAWQTGVPVVLSAIHSTGWPDEINFLNRKLTPITDSFIAVAEGHRDYLHQHEGFPLAKIQVIRNGIDIHRFQPQEQPKNDALRKSLGIPLQSPVICIVAALRPEKNHTMLLQGFSRLLELYPAAHLVIVGDGSERLSIQTLAYDLVVADQVHFLGTRHDTPELLSMSDVFVLTSHMEASPVSILEAMACAKPVVAPNVGAISESVIHEETGLLFEANNLGEFVDSLDHLLSSPEKMQAFGQTARERVVVTASLESMVQGYENLISSIYLQKRPVPAS